MSERGIEIYEKYLGASQFGGIDDGLIFVVLKEGAMQALMTPLSSIGRTRLIAASRVIASSSVIPASYVACTTRVLPTWFGLKSMACASCPILFRA